METVKSRLAEYVMIQNPSRKCITLEYGRSRRRPRYRFLLWLALAAAGVGLGWFVLFGVWAQ
jgi:hypothetical protein